jgi:hypothetical protein
MVKKEQAAPTTLDLIGHLERIPLMLEHIRRE